MKNIFRVLFISGLSLIFTTCLFSNGLNLNSVGSKATAMGGAFIGLADDYSAVFWNPAGLTQMENASFSLFATDIIPSGTYNFELLGTTMADSETKSSMYPSGALGYFKPFSKNIVVGILAYVPAGVGAKWPGEDLALLSGGTAFTWKSQIAMLTVSPVFAYKINEKFSIGASINLNYVMLKMERPAGGGAMPAFQYKEDLSGIGFGATFGAMYKPTDFLSIGVCYKTPVKASIKGDAEAPALSQMGFPGMSDAKRSATWPQWLGAGIAIKPIDRLTITADIQYNNWKKMEDIPITYSDAVWKAAGMESASNFELRWEDSVDIRFGVEYKLTDCLAIRGGYYNNPSPAPEETLNIMLPNVNYNVITAGLGYQKEKFAIDFAFEYLAGKDRFVDPMNYVVGAGMPGTHGMNIISINCAFTYKLGK